MLLIIGIIISVVTVAFMLMSNNYNEKTFTIRAITLLIGGSILTTSCVVSSQITEKKKNTNLLRAKTL